MASRYAKVYRDWTANPERFWAEAAEAIDWDTPWRRVFDPNAGVYGRWFTGATCNACHNAVDRHVLNGRGEQLAIVHDSAMTGRITSLTYAALLREVSALAAVLQDNGVVAGDRVIIYMPMVIEAPVAMLACARIGAIHSVVFGGFAANELAIRIDDATPRLIISASCGLEPGRVVAYKPLLDQAISVARHKPERCLILQRPALAAAMNPLRDIDYASAVAAAELRDRPTPCQPMPATDPLYILYTSGTTGQPKGVLRDIGGHLVALSWSIRHHYGMRPGDVFWAASDVGWVVGHSFMVYAPLLFGCTTVLYEGKPVGTPDAGAFWRVVEQHKVAALFTAPTVFRAIKGQDPDGELIRRHNISSLRTLFLGGERADPATLAWAEAKLKIPVIDNWWQTETGSPIAINPVGLGLLPVKHGSPCVVAPGYDLRVLNDEGVEVACGALGNIVLRLPLPPGCLPSLWNADQHFRSSYLEEFPGFYKTADAGYVDEDGYVFVMARTDDIINVAGHRLSTGAMEEAIARHADVAECAVIGVADALKGQIPCGFIVLNANAERNRGNIENEVVDLVRERIGAVAALRTVITVRRLPKTRSGKVLRGTLQKIADGQAWSMPATIDDAAALDEASVALSARGFTPMPASHKG